MAVAHVIYRRDEPAVQHAWKEFLEGSKAFFQDGIFGVIERNRPRIRPVSSWPSVIRIPSYTSSPDIDEQVIAREGERAGMDSVTEPEETPAVAAQRAVSMRDRLAHLNTWIHDRQADNAAYRRERMAAWRRGDRYRARAMEVAATSGGRDGRLRSMMDERERLQIRLNNNSDTPYPMQVRYGNIGRVRHMGTRIQSPPRVARPRRFRMPSVPIVVRAWNHLMSIDPPQDIELTAIPARPQPAYLMSGAILTDPVPYDELTFEQTPAYESAAPVEIGETPLQTVAEASETGEVVAESAAEV